MAVKTTTKASAAKKPAGKRRSKFWKVIKIILALIFILGVSAIIAGTVVFNRYLNTAAEKLPQLEGFRAQISSEPSKILSADSKPVVLFEIAAEKRIPIKIEDVPDRIIKATLAAEDHRFYEHEGVDTISVVRAVVTNAKGGRGGGSTLTMQLAKRLFTDSRSTFDRKLQDAAMAIQIERKYSKNAILEMYLNQVFYGQQAYGIQKAADVYFGKSLKELTWGQAATLARLVRRPSTENPYVDLSVAKSNRNVVLALLREQKWITQAEFDKAKGEDLKAQLRRRQTSAKVVSKKASYFVDYVLDEIDKKLPNIDLTTGGYKVYTTINMEMQKIAEEEVRDLVRQYRYARVKTGAFILTDKSGRILSMVGGVDYERNQFNMVTNGRRQPGSAFKPFIYAVALDQGRIGMGTQLSNEPPEGIRDPSTGKLWEPKNSDGTRGGSVDVYNAFIFSKNLPAIDCIRRLRPSRFVDVGVPAFGFESKIGANLSLALGTSEVTPLEMASAYSVFMNMGERHPAFGIVSVEGPDGQVIENLVPNPMNSGLKKSTMEQMDYLMRGVVNSGTATRASGVPNAHGKTGTTNDNRDAWFAGYTDELLGIGWISNEQKDEKDRWVYPEMSSEVFGGTVTIKMWRGIIRRCQRIIKEQDSGRPRYSSTWSESGSSDSEKEFQNRRRKRDRDAEPTDPNEPAVEADPNEGVNVDPDPDGTVPVDQGAPAIVEPEPEPEPRNRPSGGFVTIYICPDSGNLARSGCPEQRPVRYRRGEEPGRYCNHNHN